MIARNRGVKKKIRYSLGSIKAKKKKNMNSKVKSARRQNIRFGIRKKISGVAAKPRLSVFRSNTEIYAQLIDDVNGLTLAAASSKEKNIVAQKGTKSEKSKLVGAAIAAKATELGLKDVVFDRGGYFKQSKSRRP